MAKPAFSRRKKCGSCRFPLSGHVFCFPQHFGWFPLSSGHLREVSLQLRDPRLNILWGLDSTDRQVGLCSYFSNTGIMTSWVQQKHMVFKIRFLTVICPTRWLGQNQGQRPGSTEVSWMEQVGSCETEQGVGRWGGYQGDGECIFGGNSPCVISDTCWDIIRVKGEFTMCCKL